jgi:hypothetical protein
VSFDTDAVKKLKNVLSPVTYGELVAVQGVEEEDDDYIDIPDVPKKFGKIIELWLQDNINCPICDSATLICYANPNMPVIDFVCTNQSHNIKDGPIFWQVKATKGGILPYLNKSYFKIKEPNHIFVGSRVYGDVIHNIKPSDSDIDKTLLIGYILIVYEYTEIDAKQSIKIDTQKSNIVYPNNAIENITTNVQNDWYYKYINSINTKNVIQFNPTTCIHRNIAKDMTGTLMIDAENIQLLEKYNYVRIPNPYADTCPDGVKKNLNGVFNTI